MHGQRASNAVLQHDPGTAALRATRAWGSRGSAFSFEIEGTRKRVHRNGGVLSGELFVRVTTLLPLPSSDTCENTAHDGQKNTGEWHNQVRYVKRKRCSCASM